MHTAFISLKLIRFFFFFKVIMSSRIFPDNSFHHHFGSLVGDILKRLRPQPFTEPIETVFPKFAPKNLVSPFYQETPPDGVIYPFDGFFRLPNVNHTEPKPLIEAIVRSLTDYLGSAVEEKHFYGVTSRLCMLFPDLCDGSFLGNVSNLKLSGGLSLI
jgi:hypothetical protein